MNHKFHTKSPKLRLAVSCAAIFSERKESILRQNIDLRRELKISMEKLGSDIFVTVCIREGARERGRVIQFSLEASSKRQKILIEANIQVIHILLYYHFFFFLEEKMGEASRFYGTLWREFLSTLFLVRNNLTIHEVLRLGTFIASYEIR